MTQKPETMLYADSNRGVYIPQYFAQSIKRDCVTNIHPEDWAALEDSQDTERYWETWEHVLNNAIVTDENGTRYSLHQDGDLWLIPEGMGWDDDTETFQWPEEETAD